MNVILSAASKLRRLCLRCTRLQSTYLQGAQFQQGQPGRLPSSQVRTISSTTDNVFMMRIAFVLIVFSLAIHLAGCRTEENKSTPSSENKSLQPIPPSSQSKAETVRPDPDESDITILFLGNSHTDSHNLPAMVAKLIRAGDQKQTAYVESVAWGNAFLADHVNHRRSMNRVHARQWDVMVLQAQKYSTTGKYSYPTDAAEKLISIGKSQGTKVVMFPEWGRVGHPDEAARVQTLHETIAGKSGAVVAPVGLAWDRCQAEEPDLKLHASDGNHCNEAGAFLTACVLYGTITGLDPRGIENDAGANITVETRQTLQQVAWQTLQDSRVKPSKIPDRSGQDTDQ